jgi:mono/diheme cytochrome c family protein
MKKNVPLLFLWLALAACGGSDQPAQQTQTAPPTQPDREPAKPAQDPAMIELLAKGKIVYDANCLVCHQADGAGVPGLNPPLAGSEWVTGDKARLIATVLNGVRGPITVKGQRYNGVMPQQSHLPDADIAAALTYVRNSFGNAGEVIAPEEVKAARK